VDLANVVRVLKEERDAIVSGVANTEAHITNLQKRLEAVDSAIAALEPLCDESFDAAENAPGITHSMRAIFKSNKEHYLTPTQVRDALKTHGLMKGYDNEMAVIHQVISRLKDQGQLLTHATEKAYRWKSRNAVGILGGPGHDDSLAGQIARTMLKAKEEK
jgi:hypothetical protein